MLEKRLWDKPVSHGEILKKIWKHLDLGTLERSHPFHTPVFGTVCDDAPELRMVVLRRFWRRPPQLCFHSHVNAPKIRQLRANPRAYWLFYHPQEKFQLRIKGMATLHADDELHEEQWLATELFSRRCYIGADPSQVSDHPTSGLPENLINGKPSPEESEAGKANFVVVTSSIEEIDCYELNVKGHRRSLFTWHDNGELRTKWLTP
jgi:hypothetical protein